MDSQDLKALRKFVGDLPCKVNFIPYNPVPGLPYRSPTRDEIERFLHAAQSLNQAITLRKSRGAEICGACGQLAIL
jgi:23S rRNA (adenine2503-C2)-methyltransferase